VAENLPERRQCPTRSDGAVPLIAHWITVPTCAERQRCHYHKCYTCTYRGQGATAGVPRVAALAINGSHLHAPRQRAWTPAGAPKNGTTTPAS
jgi:hypothetical protein